MTKKTRQVVKVGDDAGATHLRREADQRWLRGEKKQIRHQVLKQFERNEIDLVLASLDQSFIVEHYELTLPAATEALSSVSIFYLENVVEHKLDPNPAFSEAGYLQRNHDVADAVLDGSMISGFHHWLRYGQKEGRQGGEVFKRSKVKRLKLTDFDLTSGLSSLTADQIASILVDSGAINFDEYNTRYPDLSKSGVDPILHYVQWGHKEGRVIHDLFDHQHYVRLYPEVEALGIFPLLDYLFVGAKKGRRPHPTYDVNEYIARYEIDLTTSNPLIHYSLNKSRGVTLKMPFFDELYYRETYPEVNQYPDGPFLHFIRHGVFEGRRPNPNFNPRYYYSKHLNNDYSVNALQHYIEHGAALNLDTDFPKNIPTTSREIAFFANPGPQFEELDVNLSKGRSKRANLIAFYLPQFHAFPENNEWWGKGFTEWRNIPRGVPRFAGHYQPRVPRDLSYYDLSDPSVMRRQVEMALEMGLSGFCFYFYWFDRHRLMEKPLDQFVADKTIEFPFMILWANENWTRRWDGMEAEILIKQNQREEDDIALVDCFQSYFADKRYIRIGGRPFLVIYRADILNNSVATLAKWRRLFKERHNEEPLIFLAQTFKAEHPDKFGFDGAIEFPPHKLGNMIRPINDKLTVLDWDFTGQVFDYKAGVEASLVEPAPSFSHIKTVFPSWDNNARRQTGGTVYHGSTPSLFAKWLDGAIQYSKEHPVGGKNIVFLNAWNEWAEGAYLEPDIHFGGAMLNALARTVSAGNAELQGEKFKLLLIGHDAFPAGAQINLLEMAKVLQNRFGINVHIMLLGEGTLLSSYREEVPTVVCKESNTYETLSAFAEKGFKYALTNTTGASSLARMLKELDFNVVSLVHELPHIIKTSKMEVCAEILRDNADYVVFATNTVRDAFVAEFGDIKGEIVVRPQGIYKTFERDEACAHEIRAHLGISDDAKIVLNVAYGDLRKGIDLFCQIARAMAQTDPDYHFVWVGEIHLWIEQWIVSDVIRQKMSNIHFVGAQQDVDRWMSAADVFFLTSREDPFPSVIMEAMQVGLPIVAFLGNGGFADLIGPDEKLGKLVQQGETQGTIQALRDCVDCSAENKAYRISKAKMEFDFADYLFDLLRLFEPDLKKVSVVVPNYNYASYIRARLNTIFEQTYPIYETIVIDDCSTDDSLEEIARTLSSQRRSVTLMTAGQNSGNVFKQWEKALEAASGELLWIAEADDLAEPVLVERLAAFHGEIDGCTLAFSDSRSIDESGLSVYDSYIPYAENVSPGALSKDSIFDAKEFAEKVLGVANLVLNGSSVLWNRHMLQKAFKRANPDLSGIKLVGDWLIYLSACEEEGKIGYYAKPVNIHRRHSKSVTHALDNNRHIVEIKKMHRRATKVIGKKVLIEAQAKYLQDVDAWLAG